MSDAVLNTHLDLPQTHKGKVRDIFDLGEHLLFVASDRLSAFDVVFNEGIPDKGRVLTQISEWWANQLKAAQPFHLVTSDIREMGSVVAGHKDLFGRAQMVEKLDMLPVECVVRGFLLGSGWKDYQRTGKVCGHPLPEGMLNGDRLPEVIFTPATKADVGDHDENIDFDRMVDIVGGEMAEELRSRSLEIFAEGQQVAAEKGLVLVDTKFEFGRRPDGTIVLADEVLTPDSSRYFDAAEAAETPRGKTPPSFDKQIVRDYLETLDWDKSPPPPVLPTKIIEQARARYRELFLRLTGQPLLTDADLA